MAIAVFHFDNLNFKAKARRSTFNFKSIFQYSIKYMALCQKITINHLCLQVNLQCSKNNKRFVHFIN